MVGFLGDGQHLDTSEGGLPTPLVVERGDPHKTMSALLHGERAVGERRLDREGGRLQACLFRVGRVVHLDGVTVTFRPPQIHAHQLLREIRGINPSGLGANGDQRIPGVILAGEQGTHLECLDVLGEPVKFTLNIGSRFSVVLLDGQFEHDGGIVETASQRLETLNLGLPRGEGRGDPLGVVLVIPKIGSSHLLREPRYLSAQPRQVSHRLDGFQGPAELVNLGHEVCISHKRAFYRLVPVPMAG